MLNLPLKNWLTPVSSALIVASSLTVVDEYIPYSSATFLIYREASLLRLCSDRV